LTTEQKPTKTNTTMNKKTIIAYWVTTALVCIGMLGSGMQQILRTREITEILTHLGYPVYFMVLIGVWKILAVAALLIPGMPRLKEWAYAGLFFTMTGALISHLACGDHGFKELMGPIMQSLFIMASWYLRPANRKLAS
jgi:uncharacterized membrane protein YphA (DoxX/SURF4 family)